MGHVIEVKVSPRARRMRLSVHPDGRAVLTVPERHTAADKERFLAASAEWLARTYEKVSSRKNLVALPTGRRSFNQHKERARGIIEARTAELARAHGFEFSRIYVRDQKTRWGSCSRNRNLSFNYRIALLPERVMDYVIVHELSHLRHFNHSHMFWNCVEAMLPDYKRLRKELKTYTL